MSLTFVERESVQGDRIPGGSDQRSGRGGGWEVRIVGGKIHQEYWIGDLEEFNKNSVGLIEVVAEFRMAEANNQEHSQ
jgi:hypothetical protein